MAVMGSQNVLWVGTAIERLEVVVCRLRAIVGVEGEVVVVLVAASPVVAGTGAAGHMAHKMATGQCRVGVAHPIAVAVEAVAHMDSDGSSYGRRRSRGSIRQLPSWYTIELFLFF
jgi:hypothetical protein